MILDQLNDILYSTDHQDLNHLIARYIKKNFKTIPNMNIEELASACYVSKAKISYYIKKLGFASFKEFKETCKKESLQQDYLLEVYEENIQLNYFDHLELSLKQIEKSLKQVDINQLNGLVKMIARCEKLYVYGLGYNQLLCQYLQGEFDLLHKEVIVMDDQLKKDYQVGIHDFILIISVDGQELIAKKRRIQKLLHYTTRILLLTTTPYLEEYNRLVPQIIAIPTKQAELNDRKFILRYMLDTLIRRYQYLYY